MDIYGYTYILLDMQICMYIMLRIYSVSYIVSNICICINIYSVVGTSGGVTVSKLD